VKIHKDNNTNFKPMKINKNSNTKEKTMKLLLTLSLASLLLFFGCDQKSEITTPVEESSTQEYSLISLPTPTGGLSVEALLAKYKEIDGDNGGTFIASFNYEGGPFGDVQCTSRLIFSPGAFNGVTEIQKTLDSESAAMIFGPQMEFNLPVKCSLRFYGLDLSNVNPETLDFVYIALDGTFQHCEYDTIEMNAGNGYLMVRNAQLNHFSRYGFVNGQE
jgi:hypothetical protein